MKLILSLPTPLRLACIVVLVEAAAYAVLGASLIPSFDSRRVAMDSTTLIFMWGLAAAMVWCAFNLARLESWARAPLVMVQLIQIPVAISFWGGETVAVAVALLLCSALVLFGIFHPTSIQAVEESDAA